MLAARRKLKPVYPGAVISLALLLIGPHPALSERLPVKTWTTSEGLAHDHVKRLVRDSHGFLWFCTLDGLSRFDGYRFTTYRGDHGLPVPFVYDLLETRQGVYWVATANGVYRFNPAAAKEKSLNATEAPDENARGSALFTNFTPGQEHAANVITTLYEDSKGQVWVGTEAGLFLLREANNQVVFERAALNLPRVSDSTVAVQAILEDQQGALWLGTSAGLVRRWPDGRIVHYTAQPKTDSDRIRGLFFDRAGRLWFGHDHALVVLWPDAPASWADSERLSSRTLPGRANGLDPRTGRLRWPTAPGQAFRYGLPEGLTTSGVRAIYQSLDGRIWIGHNDGLTGCDDDAFREYGSHQGVSGNAVNSFAEDRDGNLWIGTDTGGALKVAQNGPTSYGTAEGLGHAWIASVSENYAGTLYVVSGELMISQFNGQRFTFVRPDLPARLTAVMPARVALQDRVGEWWVATAEGLFRFPRVERLEQLAHTQPKRVYTTGDGLPFNKVVRLCEDSRGDLWLATRASGQPALTRWDRATGTFHHYSADDGLPSFEGVGRFTEDGAGNLWVGLRGAGLARYANGRFTLVSTGDDSLSSELVLTYCDQSGRLWLALSGGRLMRCDNPTEAQPRFAPFSRVSDWRGLDILCLTDDQWGRLYLGTARGIEQLDPATGRSRHYTTADGLSNNEVTSAFRDRTGALWFGTLDGLSRLTPSRDALRAPPPVLISGLRIAGNQYAVSELGEAGIEGFTLEPSQNHLTVDFFSLSFSAGETLRYQYRLEGGEPDWSAPGEQHSVSFANLAPGRYRFLVRAVTSNGQVSEQPAMISFLILPPVWERWWFLALVGLMIAAATVFFYRYRVSQLVELERVRTRIATDLHDDIGSGLSQVSVLSEVINRRAGHDPTVVEPLLMIAGLSRDLVDSMNDIVWALNPQRDRLSDLTHRLRRLASDVFTAREIDFEFTAPEMQHDLKLGPETRREVFLIFKESVNNIVRHSGCTKAGIEFSHESGWLILSLRDNGKGFDPAAPCDGNGLASLRERARRIGGTLEIISDDGRGTTVRLKVPPGRRARSKGAGK